MEARARARVQGEVTPPPCGTAARCSAGTAVELPTVPVPLAGATPGPDTGEAQGRLLRDICSLTGTRAGAQPCFGQPDVGYTKFFACSLGFFLNFQYLCFCIFTPTFEAS